MPAFKRRHSPSSSPSRRVSGVTDEAPASSYALSALYPPDKLGFPSSSPALLPSVMSLSSPQRFAYRDPTASDTESDSGASDDEIEESLASFPPEEAAPFKGKGKAVDRGRTSGIHSGRAHRYQTATKLQAALGLGHRPRSRMLSARGRIVSPTESIYIMTQGMSTLKTSPVQPDEEHVVSSALNSDRRDSSPSPVPSSPEPSDIDTPVPRTRKLAMSRLALAKSKKRRADAVRSAMDSASRRASNDAWDAHEGNTIDRATLEKLAAQQGLKIVPMSPTPREKALGASGASTSVYANASVAGHGNKRVRSPSPPPSTPAAIENLLTPARKLVRAMSSPTSPTPGPSKARALGGPQTLKASKSLRTLDRGASTPMPANVPSTSPRAIDLVEDVVLATASEDDDSEHEEEPTPTKPKRNKLPVKRPIKLATKLVSRSKARKRYEREHPKADHLPVRRRPKVHHVGANASESEPERAPTRQRRRRLHLARRPVALRCPRRTVFFFLSDADPEDGLLKEPKPLIKCRKITERVRRGLLQRHNQRTKVTLTTPAPVIAMTTTHKRQASESPDQDDLAVDELLSDAEMLDSEAVETVVSLASPSQLAGRKRRNLPVDDSTGRNSQRTILRAIELSWYEPEYRKHEAWRRERRDPARAGERAKARYMSHIAAKEAEQQAAEAARREEEAEGWIDDVLVADAEMHVAEPVVALGPTAPSHAAVSGPTADPTLAAHVSPVTEGTLAADSSRVAPACPAEHVEQNETNLQTSSEVVEGLLTFEHPGPVQVIEEESQPPMSRDSQTLGPRPRRRRVHEYVGPSAGARAAAGPARRDRILSRERRRATTAPPEEPMTEAVAGPSTRTRPAASAGPSNPTAVEGLRSPPPRYEFPFYDIVRTPVRTVRPPPPRPTGRQRERAVSNPPDYTGPYEARSPAPPPPYNSVTDRDTIIAPVFDEPAPRPAAPSHGPSLNVRRQRDSDSARRAPGTWPAGSTSPTPEDVDMDAPQPQHQQGVIASVFSRVFGFWRS
ncbi:hypothetical protein CcaverHIS002_0207930 [Cutaneotrichosporon cavernicola]|uniref:Uncharacterized protein n=1 Tax=Cutaneotrichosporon cavernicola TaxID=279322 RepID=A0AA48I991_9TREE|nr:uncharacterized protein CcaverHIS019_0207920 [Cutaneotrichosporon cavernicola]BEI81633.1 hypothetical protein CcaverHIS002_0207930 [Cutaneotrichosporon cavernicola]BEI89430.1 hypothetical protein CcaverHIS019_0207920 [Cutaneotrichosporon cavernicola]BEI97204.1 hypothetical protein CcaverHIS631_0207930 [Cutaneotrichosporon cavernicola]BEJ04978.1 hypothetical protein CcaverHIS641_0207950 [Cutaneotrichosporon cavernicola]